MKKNQVSYVFCEKYDPDLLEKAVERIFLSFPSFEEKLKSKSSVNILIKPNLLAARHPDKAITTHPLVLKAIIKYLEKFNCNITVADSPAGIYNKKSLEKLYKACQIDTVIQQTNCKLNYDTSDEVIEFPDGKILKKCLMIKPAVEADFIINIAKLKTHSLTRLTCATKNLFGLVPGVLKYRQHIAIPDLRNFSRMLLDIIQYFEDKTFHIVDGIIGMEGEGPGSLGEPKFAGALFGGENSNFVDILACYIMGLPVNTVPTLVELKGMEDIELINSDDVRTYNFKLPPARNKTLPSYIPNFIQDILTELIVAKPLIEKNLCLKCNVCIEACPAEIISSREKGAYIQSYKKCIRCYCCQEACPHKAIKLSKPVVERVYRLFRRFRSSV